jgi:hypothetical protein
MTSNKTNTIICRLDTTDLSGPFNSFHLSPRGINLPFSAQIGALRKRKMGKKALFRAFVPSEAEKMSFWTALRPLLLQYVSMSVTVIFILKMCCFQNQGALRFPHTVFGQYPVPRKLFLSCWWRGTSRHKVDTTLDYADDNTQSRENSFCRLGDKVQYGTRTVDTLRRWQYPVPQQL